jgi:ribosomal protein L37AE/L43A
MPTITMFDQMLFSLACGHTVVLGRLAAAEVWTCETCGKTTNLNSEPHRSTLEKDRDTADQIDKQARARGETIVRAHE